MKTKLKKYGVWGIVLILIVLLSVSQWKGNKIRSEKELAEIQLSTYKDSVTIYKAINGSLTYSIQSIEVERDNAKKALEIAGFEIKDLKSRNIKWRNIIFGLQAQITAFGSGVIVLHDSIPVPGQTLLQPIKTGKWSDDYLTLTPALKGEELLFDYHYQTGLKLAQSKVGKNYQVNAFLVNPKNPDLPNPKAEFTTMNSITIIPDPPAWWNHWYMYLGAGFIGGMLIK